jgi:putative restriction endonuclease
MSRQGIFKPRVLEDIPISITTTTHGPYDDHMSSDGLILYSYRGTDPSHPENAGLRKAMFQRTPLIYFHGVLPGKYIPNWPVFIVGDSPEKLMFSVAVDDRSYINRYSESQEGESLAGEQQDLGRRRYITAIVSRRLHQTTFRERVLDAYQQSCSLCRLHHSELLDAAHIIPDTDAGGEPVISNGIALCKLHHAAFDKFFLGIRPDYIIHVPKSILDETDGPMLMHGLKGLHGHKILLPRSSKQYPSVDRLEIRYKRFLHEAGG